MKVVLKDEKVQATDKQKEAETGKTGKKMGSRASR